MGRATFQIGSATLTPPPFCPDPSSRVPVYRQLADYLRDAIHRGHLAPGVRLPSSRTLAAHLHLSRNTVLTAYETLAAQALIQGKRGSATRVSGQPPKPKSSDLRFLLRHSHYPFDAVSFRDPDGNPLYVHR